MTTPIADYAIVGDGRSAALISRAGSLDWLCWPRFDSPSIFAAILDEERGGRFSVAPGVPFRSTRAYLGETNVLETRFLTASGELALTDFMPVLSGIDSARSMYPGHELVRVVRCKRGAVDVAIVFDPRPDYGRRKAAIRTMGKLGLRVDCGGDAILSLLTDAPLGAEVDPALAVEPEVDGRRNRLARAPEGDDQRVPPAIERGEVLRRAGPPAHIECAGVANRVEEAVLRVVQPR